MTEHLGQMSLDTPSAAHSVAKPERKPPGLALGWGARKSLGKLGSYAFLTLGAIFMLFPVFWMVTAALKPTWQISARDILIPSFWHKTPAGSTLRLINLWTAPSPEDAETRHEVILFGARRQYLTMLDASRLGQLMAIPRDQAGKVEVLAIGDFLFNALTYQDEKYLLLGTDADNLLALPQSALDVETTAVVIPRSQQRAAQRGEVSNGVYTLPVRQIDVPERGVLDLVEAGPIIELSTVLPAAYAQHAILVAASDLGEKDTLPLGDSEADQYTLNSDPSGERYVLIEQSDWRPVAGIDILRADAFTIPQSEFISDGETVTTASGAVFPVGAYKDQQVAVVLEDLIRTSATPTLLVMSVDKLDSVRMVLATSLFGPRPTTVDGTTVRVKDFDHPAVEEENIDLTRMPHQVGMLGQSQDMVLLIPASIVTELYDVFSGDLERKLSVTLQGKNFVRAMVRTLGDSTFLTFFFNSTLIAVMNIIGNVFSCTVVAYAFARMRAPGRNLLFSLVLATLMMPGFITVIPVYRIFRDLGMVDTLWPMFLRSFFGNAFLIFLLRQFFTTIPIELEEAARIDGASRLQTFFRIMVPLITPALTTIVIFSFLWSWNDAFSAAIYLNSPQNYTVAIGLRQFLGQYSSEFNLLMAAASVVMLPTVILFFFAQRYFIEGITLTGMKG